MANKQRGELDVTVGGTVYTLRPTFDCFCELEDLVGKGMLELLQAINRGHFSAVRAVAWANLHEKHGDEIKTLKDASEWIERAGGVDIVLDWLNQVLKINEPDETHGGAPNPPVAQTDGTGERSSEVPVASV